MREGIRVPATVPFEEMPTARLASMAAGVARGEIAALGALAAWARVVAETVRAALASTARNEKRCIRRGFLTSR
jgi:hypothetical protein